MRVGMYIYPGLENVPLLDKDGVPEGEWVGIGPLRLEE